MATGSARTETVQPDLRQAQEEAKSERGWPLREFAREIKPSPWWPRVRYTSHRPSLCLTTLTSARWVANSDLSAAHTCRAFHGLVLPLEDMAEVAGWVYGVTPSLQCCSSPGIASRSQRQNAPPRLGGVNTRIPNWKHILAESAVANPP